jgi:glycosyltransferase involved in cell wall biosynthesis
MRIWIVITNLQGGGAERAVINIAEGLTARGHRLKIILLEDQIDHAIPTGLEIVTTGQHGRKITKGWIGSKLAAWRLRRWFNQQAESDLPDLVISTLPFADRVVRAANLPNVWYRIANTLSAELDRLGAGNLRRAERRLARFRRVYKDQNIIAVSDGVAADFTGRLEIRCAQIVTIYNPIDADKIRQLSQVEDRHLPAEPFVIHAGRFSEQKRHDLLLDAFAASAIPHKLVLLTKPSGRLRALIDSKGLTDRVILAGFQSNPYPWFARASALILSSDAEGFPNVIVEALACGTPVVSTNCPSGPSEILTGALSRYLSPCGDATALAKNLNSVVQLPPDIKKDSVSRFSREASLDLIEGLAMRSRSRQLR